MALKSSRTQSQLLCDAVAEHIRKYGKDNKVICYSYCKIADYLVGSFRLNENGEPEVVLVNGKGELNILSARDFNVGECRLIQEAIVDSEDAINYRACRDAINRQTVLATDAERSMKELFALTKTGGNSFADNLVPLEISGQRIVGFAFDPQKNSSLGGEYSLLVEGHYPGRHTEWVWNLSNKALELVCDCLRQNIDKVSARKTERKAKGVTIK